MLVYVRNSLKIDFSIVFLFLDLNMFSFPICKQQREIERAISHVLFGRYKEICAKMN